MIVVIDTREGLPYAFTRFKDVEIETAALDAGDYSLKGFEDKIAIERKTINDLVGCLSNGRDRFEKELARSRSYERFFIVVEATLADLARGRYTSKMNPEAALQSIFAFMTRYNFPFVFAGDRRGGEYVTYSLLSKYLYEIRKRYQAATKSQSDDYRQAAA